MSTFDGGPAFPGDYSDSGFSKRDLVAMRIYSDLVAKSPTSDREHLAKFAKTAFDAAGAFVAELEAVIEVDQREEADMAWRP